MSDETTLTPEAVDAMEAGPELDEAVALILGWKPPKVTLAPQVKCPDCGDWNYFNPPAEIIEWRENWHWMHPDGSAWSDLPDYSSDIAAAWELVEHFAGPARDRRCVVVAITEPGEWCCEIGAEDMAADTDVYAPVHTASAPTAPLAIARASLKAALAGRGRGTP